MATSTLPPDLTTFMPSDFAVRAKLFGSTRCHVDGQAITWGGTTIAYRDIVAVAYSTRTRNGIVLRGRTDRGVWLSDGARNLRMLFGASIFATSTDNEQRSAYQAVLAAVHHHVEPGLRTEMLRTIAAGGPVAIGGLRLDRNGVSHPDGNDRVEWRQLPSAQLEDGHVVVTVTSERERAVLARLPMREPNAVLLPELLAEASVPFS